MWKDSFAFYIYKKFHVCAVWTFSVQSRYNYVIIKLAEAYLEHSQTSMTERFCGKNRFILDLQLSPKYTTV